MYGYAAVQEKIPRTMLENTKPEPL